MPALSACIPKEMERAARTRVTRTAQHIGPSAPIAAPAVLAAAATARLEAVSPKEGNMRTLSLLLLLVIGGAAQLDSL